MVKTKMCFSDLMKQPHYKSIFNLTLKFQGENGLQYKHYSYALEKNSKVSESTFIVNVFGIKSEKLKELYESGEIAKDCILPGKSLNNFLSKLVYDYGYLEIANPGEKNRRYKISLLPFNEFLRKDIVYQIEEYPRNLINGITGIETDIQDNLPYNSHFIGGIFGFPTRYEKYVKESDCKEIKQSIINIYKELNRINNIKLKYMDGASHVSFYGKAVIDPKIDEYMSAVKKMIPMN